MYGRNYDDFEYRGVLFRWVLSPNRFIYRIYVESELIGTIPVSQVRARMLPSAIEALYPICDTWIGEHGVIVYPEVELGVPHATIQGEDYQVVSRKDGTFTLDRPIQKPKKKRATKKEMVERKKAKK